MDTTLVINIARTSLIQMKNKYNNLNIKYSYAHYGNMMHSI